MMTNAACSASLAMDAATVLALDSLLQHWHGAYAPSIHSKAFAGLPCFLYAYHSMAACDQPLCLITDLTQLINAT